MIYMQDYENILYKLYIKHLQIWNSKVLGHINYLNQLVNITSFHVVSDNSEFL